jgi:hypothetical protein
MGLTKARIFREDHEVNSRLAELRLEKAKLLSVRSIAVAAAADATPFHPANAAGTFSYQQGTFALRMEHDGDGWASERPNGVEAIHNGAINVRVVFANVDVACHDEHEPRPRSGKGAGAERLCQGNDLFGGLPRYVDISGEMAGTTYYLMVAPNGAAELSCATVKGGKWEKFIERLYLSDGSDLDGEAKLPLDDQEKGDEFDPKVVRK